MCHCQIQLPREVTVRWRIDARGKWYGFLREEDAARFGIPRRVELVGDPHGIREGEIWKSRVVKSRYNFNPEDKSPRIEAWPIRRIGHPNEKEETTAAVKEAKKLVGSLALFEQKMVDLGDGRIVQSEIRLGQGNLAREWVLFKRITLASGESFMRRMGEVIDDLTPALQATRAGSCNFQVKNLEQAIATLGVPSFVYEPTSQHILASWQDALGNTLEAFILPENLVKSIDGSPPDSTEEPAIPYVTLEKIKPVKKLGIHRLLGGEIVIHGMSAEPIRIHTTLAVGEIFDGEVLAPARLTTTAKRLPKSLRLKIKQELIGLGWFNIRNEYTWYLHVLNNFRREAGELRKVALFSVYHGKQKLLQELLDQLTEAFDELRRNIEHGPTLTHSYDTFLCTEENGLEKTNSLLAEKIQKLYPRMQRRYDRLVKFIERHQPKEREAPPQSGEFSLLQDAGLEPSQACLSKTPSRDSTHGVFSYKNVQTWIDKMRKAWFYTPFAPSTVGEKHSTSRRSVPEKNKTPFSRLARPCACYPGPVHGICCS